MAVVISRTVGRMAARQRQALQPPAVRKCNCAEGIRFKAVKQVAGAKGGVVDGESVIRLLMPQVHDCSYVRMRNSLIPIAEREVLLELGSDDAPGYAVAFLARMSRLVKERLAAEAAVVLPAE